jgi:hypothetical protein
MTQVEIELIDDSPTKHRICFKTPESFKGKLTKVYDDEKDNLAVIDKYISDLNKSNGDIISEYNYEIIDEKNFTVALLFKHLFRAMNTTQKYAKCTVSLGESHVDITFDSRIDVRLKSQGKSDHVPIIKIRASYEVSGDELHHTVEFETVDDVETYKCYVMLIAMIKEGIISIVEEIEKLHL